MVEEASLPKCLTVLLGIRTAAFDLESFKEVKKISPRIEAFCQEMQVVGHEAIGVDGEMSRCRFVGEKFEQLRTTRWIFEDRSFVETAERCKVNLLAQIVGWGGDGCIFGLEVP